MANSDPLKPFKSGPWYLKLFSSRKYGFISRYVIRYFVMALVIYTAIITVCAAYKTILHISTINYLLFIAGIQIVIETIMYLLIWIYRIVKKQVNLRAVPAEGEKRIEADGRRKTDRRENDR